jgi:hypothetical protein
MMETGDVEDMKAETDISNASVPKELLTWEIDYAQQATDEHTKQLVQLVSFRSKKPIVVFDEVQEIPSQSTEVYASEKIDEALALLDSYKQKNSLLLWFAIIAVSLLLIISILVLLKLN